MPALSPFSGLKTGTTDRPPLSAARDAVSIQRQRGLGEASAKGLEMRRPTPQARGFVASDVAF